MESQIRDSVLHAIAYDYESVELVLEHVRRFDDPAVTTQQVSVALGELIKAGSAQAYELSPKPPHARTVDFDPGRMEELWFYVTPKGKDLVLAHVARTDN
jgi:hypothetical protein